MKNKYEKQEKRGLEQEEILHELTNWSEIQENEKVLENYRKLAKERKIIPINENLKSYTLIDPKNEEDENDCDLYIKTNGLVKIYNSILKEVIDLINILGFDMDKAFNLINEENLEKIYDKDILSTVIELEEKVCKLDRFTKTLCESECKILS